MDQKVDITDLSDSMMMNRIVQEKIVINIKSMMETIKENNG